jgi:hypothetical protein
LGFFQYFPYIFGTTEGSLGFLLFLNYFLAVLLVNNQSTTLDWAIYSIIPYAVVSILFIPKLWLEKKRINEMVTVGSIQDSLFRILFSPAIFYLEFLLTLIIMIFLNLELFLKV